MAKSNPSVQLRHKHSKNGCFGAYPWYNGALVLTGQSTKEGCVRCPLLDKCVSEMAKITKELFPLITKGYAVEIASKGYEQAGEQLRALTNGAFSDPYQHTAIQNWEDGNAGKPPGTYYAEMRAPQ